MTLVLTNQEGALGAGLAATMLAQGRSALDAVEAGVRQIEADERVRSVGRGGWPNLLGEVELDAAVMDGTTLQTGAVGALQGFLHPVSVARQIIGCLPHVLLVGDGAARFAREIGAERSENVIADSRAAWDEWFRAELSEEERRTWPDVRLAALCMREIVAAGQGDTTVFLALDSAGDIAVATSTSGWGWKYPGRLSDSPIAGAGFYADTRYGACACTGTGEMAIRAGTARSVVLYLKMGMNLSQAVHEAAADMARLRGGLISGVAIHAIDAQGNHIVVSANGRPTYRYWLWRDGMAAPEDHPVDDIVVTAPNVRAPSPPRYARQRS
jgi:beta-aspartyl-peptidase (threonine type)